MGGTSWRGVGKMSGDQMGEGLWAEGIKCGMVMSKQPGWGNQRRKGKKNG